MITVVYCQLAKILPWNCDKSSRKLFSKFIILLTGTQYLTEWNYHKYRKNVSNNNISSVWDNKNIKYLWSVAAKDCSVIITKRKNL